MIFLLDESLLKQGLDEDRNQFGRFCAPLLLNRLLFLKTQKPGFFKKPGFLIQYLRHFLVGRVERIRVKFNRGIFFEGQACHFPRASNDKINYC